MRSEEWQDDVFMTFGADSRQRMLIGGRGRHWNGTDDIVLWFRLDASASEMHENAFSIGVDDKVELTLGQIQELVQRADELKENPGNIDAVLLGVIRGRDERDPGDTLDDDTFRVDGLIGYVFDAKKIIECIDANKQVEPDPMRKLILADYATLHRNHKGELERSEKFSSVFCDFGAYLIFEEIRNGVVVLRVDGENP